LNADPPARIPRSTLLTTLALLLLLVSASLWAQDDAVVADVGQEGYRLGAGDVVRVTVHNHADLSGDFTLDGAGTISMSLIGTVDASGLTASELESRITGLLKPDYLVNPRVTVRVQNYRPYYLIGEVNSTGAFNYVQGMTFMTAIAIAGGYSYRAKKDVVFVKRGGSEEEVEMNVHEKLQPGDIIRVAERLF
jgi:polysaccharide export outer membrane protein